MSRIKGGPEFLAPAPPDHPADVPDPDNNLALADRVEIAAGRQPDTLEK